MPLANPYAVGVKVWYKWRASRREAPTDKKKSDWPLRAYQKSDVSLPAISKTDPYCLIGQI